MRLHRISMIIFSPSSRSKSHFLLLVAAACFGLLVAHPGSAGSCEVLVVKNSDLKPYQEVTRGLTDAGACEVRELTLRDGEGVEKIMQRPGDVIVALGTTAFRKVRTIKDLPMVYTMVMPSDTAHQLPPNISGVDMNLSPEAVLSAIREVFPKAKRIGLIYDPQNAAPYVEEAARAARAAGIELVAKQVRHSSEVPGSLDSLHDGIDVFWMLPDPTVVTVEAVDYLLRFSFQHNLPIFSFSKKYVDLGAVAALDLDLYDMGVQAGELASALALGKTGPLRVYARKASLAINTKVASKMGMKIPEAVMKKVKGLE